MDERKQNNHPWDDSVYGTGRTQPPKSHGGLVALLLIMVIFLCGIITVLGILNVRLFHKLNTQEENDLSISFTTGATVPTQAATLPPEEAVPDAAQEVSPTIDLQQCPQSVENIPMEGGLSLQEIYSRNIDSVVSITSVSQSATATGTGVILTENGYIVTNCHVVENGVTISVQLSDSRELNARLVGADAVSDLAVLRVDANNLSPAQFGDSDALRVGDTVVAIGDPLGVKFRGTYTDGIVSGIGRDMDVNGRTMTLIQTNAALNSGNSGGPLINCYGQVIGINTMKIGAFTDSAGVEGLGFAIPSATVKDVVEQLISQGYVSGRPTLGLEGETLSSFDQYYYRLPAGLYITDVDASSDAAAKGVEEGDILLSIDGTGITTMDALNAAVYNREVGDTVEAVIYRSGAKYRVRLTLTENKG
ncbi:MAG: trypsin-like peptidase domain-containing protein [Firmicutes bacterium]|nr:trypsin-like peptidase domain-containing protein [Bacillota bacterium]